MKFTVKLLVLLLIIVPLSAGWMPALAQTDKEPTSFQNVQIWVNPEYDDPWLLIMMEGQIGGVEPPARVRFLVPADARMYSAGSKDALGKYTGGPPDRKPSTVAGWDEISYEVKDKTFRMEYYTPSINGETDKSISYEFLRVYPIDSLRVNIQQPRLATNFIVSPSGPNLVDGEGFNTSFYSFTNLDTVAPVRYQISYTKTDPRPSLQITGGGSASSTTTIIAVVVAAAAIIGAFLWATRKKKTRPVRRSAGKTSAAKQPAGKPAASKQPPPKQPAAKPRARICAVCEEPADPSDTVCSNCGNRL